MLVVTAGTNRDGGAVRWLAISLATMGCVVWVPGPDSDTRRAHDPWERDTPPVCPASNDSIEIAPDDDERAAERALVDARADPALVRDWTFLAKQRSIELVDARGARHRHLVAPGFVETDVHAVQVQADRHHEDVWIASIKSVSIDGHCAVVAVGAWPKRPHGEYGLGGCITELLYEKRAGRWTIVGRLFAACS
jgi:hypothetical protein